MKPEDSLASLHALMIDNYDSFTFNLVQYLHELGIKVTTRRNDDIDLDGVKALAPDFIVLSPGPSTPDNAGICLELVKAALTESYPVLGICLGHQTIGQAFGGRVVRAAHCVHGKTSAIEHDGSGMFRSIPPQFLATRYHSLIVDRNDLPACLHVSATLEDGTIMGLRHKESIIEGMQFHPESVLTEHGRQLLANFAHTVIEQR